MAIDRQTHFDACLQRLDPRTTLLLEVSAEFAHACYHHELPAWAAPPPSYNPASFRPDGVPHGPLGLPPVPSERHPPLVAKPGHAQWLYLPHWELFVYVDPQYPQTNPAVVTLCGVAVPAPEEGASLLLSDIILAAVEFTKTIVPSVPSVTPTCVGCVAEGPRAWPPADPDRLYEALRRTRAGVAGHAAEFTVLMDETGALREDGCDAAAQGWANAERLYSENTALGPQVDQLHARLVSLQGDVKMAQGRIAEKQRRVAQYTALATKEGLAGLLRNEVAKRDAESQPLEAAFLEGTQDTDAEEEERRIEAYVEQRMQRHRLELSRRSLALP